MIGTGSPFVLQKGTVHYVLSIVLHEMIVVIVDSLIDSN